MKLRKIIIKDMWVDDTEEEKKLKKFLNYNNWEFEEVIYSVTNPSDESKDKK